MSTSTRDERRSGKRLGQRVLWLGLFVVLAGCATSSADRLQSIQLTRAAKTKVEMTPLPEQVSLDLARALKLDPKNNEAKFLYAYAMGRRGLSRMEQMRLYEEVVKVDPKNAFAQNNLGSCLLEIPGREDECIEKYETAVLLLPNEAMFHCNLGVALAKVAGGATRALNEFDATLRIDPKYKNALLQKAMLLNRLSGRQIDAVVAFEAFLKFEPNHEVSLLALGDILMGVGRRPKQGLAYVEQAVSLYPKSVPSLLGAANAYLRIGRISEAKVYFDLTISRSPNLAVAYTGRAMAEWHEKDYDAAIRDTLTAEKLEPANVRTIVFLSGLQVAKGSFLEGLATAEEAYRRTPENPDALWARGCAYSKLNRLDEAERDFRKTLEVAPSYVVALYDLANVLEKKGQYTEALDYFARAIEVDPTATHLIGRRADIMIKIGNLTGALAEIKRVLKAKPEKTYMYRELLKVHYLLRQFAEIDEDCRQVLRLEAKHTYTLIFQEVNARRLGRPHTPHPDLETIESDSKEWTTHVVRFLWGEEPVAEFMAAAEVGDAKEISGQRCEAFYYNGMMLLMDGKRAEAQKCFEDCLATEKTAFYEYEFAQSELQALKEGK